MSLSGKEGEYLFSCQLHLLVKSGVVVAAVCNDLSSNYANITCKCAFVSYCKQLFFFLHFTLGHFGPSVKLPSLASPPCVLHFNRTCSSLWVCVPSHLTFYDSSILSTDKGQECELQDG